MIAITALAIFFTAAAICYVAEHANRIMQSLGFGYLVYHSDSQKTFWAKNYQDAIEWMQCAIGDACMFDNRTKEAIAIRFAI